MTTGLSQLLASGRLAFPCPFFICKMKVVVAATQEGQLVGCVVRQEPLLLV